MLAAVSPLPPLPLLYAFPSSLADPGRFAHLSGLCNHASVTKHYNRGLINILPIPHPQTDSILPLPLSSTPPPLPIGQSIYLDQRINTFETCGCAVGLQLAKQTDGRTGRLRSSCNTHPQMGHVLY